MHVWGDAAGHHGQGAQIVRRRGERGVESRDPRSGDDEGGVAHHAAAAVEDGTGADRDGGRLANREAGGGAGDCEQQADTRHGRASEAAHFTAVATITATTTSSELSEMV